jgi:hypothetical protein
MRRTYVSANLNVAADCASPRSPSFVAPLIDIKRLNGPQLGPRLDRSDADAPARSARHGSAALWFRLPPRNWPWLTRIGLRQRGAYRGRAT